tara:strand:- start:912 stop:2375 length:1464 start_codon:yes stop_codon:yes gene_type:complete
LHTLLSLSFIIIFAFGCYNNSRISVDNLGINIPEEWSMPIHEKSDNNKDWVTAFNDKDLISYLEAVKVKSPDLLSILENEKIGRYNAKIRGASILPSANFGFNQSESRQNLSAFGFADSFLGNQGSDSSSQINSPSSSVISFENKTFGLGLNYQWELDIWGRLLNERIAARKDYEAVRYDLSYLGFSVEVRSAILFYQGVEALEQSTLSKESYASLVEIRDLVKNRYEKGLRSSLDYRLAETSVSTAILEMENRKNQLVSINRQLETLVGEYPKGTLLKEKKLPTNLPSLPKSIPASIIERRPDIRSLILKVESNVSRVSQAKRNLLPGINLTGSLGTSTQDFEQLLDKDYGIWNLGLNVTAPIFNGKRLRSAIKVQEAAFEISRQDLIKGLLKAFSEVEQLMYFDQSLKVQINAMRSGVEQSKDAYNLSKERYDKGVTTLESVLSSQRQYNTIKSQYLQLQRQSIENRLLLILALGGDFGYISEGS